MCRMSVGWATGLPSDVSVEIFLFVRRLSFLAARMEGPLDRELRGDSYATVCSDAIANRRGLRFSFQCTEIIQSIEVTA